MQITNSLLSINYTKGRRGHYPIDAISVHVIEGSAASARNWFNNPVSQVSSHYSIHFDGTIEQFVKEEDTAWCNGRVDKPTAQIVLERPDANPNWYTISIEHEGFGKVPMPEKQKKASVWLIQDIAKRRNIPINRRHIIRHNEIYSLKPCPGVISVTELVQLAAGASTSVVYPRMVWSEFFKDYLIVTKYVSDNEWYFIPLSKMTDGTRASAQLSKMKINP